MSKQGRYYDFVDQVAEDLQREGVTFKHWDEGKENWLLAAGFLTEMRDSNPYGDYERVLSYSITLWNGKKIFSRIRRKRL